jgi:hypothetical protein
MKRLTQAEKKQLIRELRDKGWVGSLKEESLLQLAKKILEYQLR